MTFLTKVSQIIITILITGASFLPIPASGNDQELVIQNLTINHLTNNKVEISWSTNLPSFYLLEYGETNQYGHQLKNNKAAYSHQLQLSGLKEKTTYHFRIIAFTPDDKRTYTFDQIFKTKKIIDKDIPELLEFHNPLITDRNAYFYFKTNESVSATLTYWEQNRPKKIKSLKKRSNSQKYTNLTIKGLRYNTNYIYKITIKDRSGNILKLSERSFRTEGPSFALSDFYFNKIEPISINSPLIKEMEFTSKFITTRPARCTLHLGHRTISDPAYFQWSHELRVTKLKPNTNYRYYITCRDYLNKSLTSGKYNIRTKGPIVLGYSTKNQGESFGGKKFTLIKTPDSPRIYVLINRYKYHIKNPEIFNSYNLAGKKIKTITAEKLDKYPDIRVVVRESTGERYFLYLDKNMKKQILSDKVNKSYKLNKKQKPLLINDTDFFSYQNLWLVKTLDSPTVYVIRNGVKRPISSWEVFVKNNWKPWQIGIVNQTDLDSYITGSTIY